MKADREGLRRWSAIRDGGKKGLVSSGRCLKLNAADQPIDRIERRNARVDFLRRLVDLASRAMRARVLVAGEIVMQERTGRQDEGVHDDDGDRRRTRAPRFTAGHPLAYMSQ